MKKLIKINTLIFTICEFAFAGLAIAGVALGFKNADNREKEEKQIIAEAGYDAFNAEYKKEQASDLLEKFKNGELSEYEYSQATASLKDYSVETYMNKYASAEHLEEYKAILKSDYMPYVYMSMMGAGFIGMVGMAYFCKDEGKEYASSQKIKKRNGKSFTVEPLVEEDFSFDEVVASLKPTNSMAETSQETKEKEMEK